MTTSNTDPSSQPAAASPENDPPLRRIPIPLREPRAAISVAPAPVGPAGRDVVSATQGTLALALPWEAAPAAAFAASPGAVKNVRHPGQSHEGARRGSRRSATAYRSGPVAVLPEPREWATTFIQAAMEVAMGLRPAGQLIRSTTPEIQEVLARRGALVARAVRRARVPLLKPKVRALLVSMPAPRICEASAVIADPEKIRAVAFRMEGFADRWRVTVIDIG